MGIIGGCNRNGLQPSFAPINGARDSDPHVASRPGIHHGVKIAGVRPITVVDPDNRKVADANYRIGQVPKCAMTSTIMKSNFSDYGRMGPRVATVRRLRKQHVRQTVSAIGGRTAAETMLPGKEHRTIPADSHVRELVVRATRLGWARCHYLPRFALITGV